MDEDAETIIAQLRERFGVRSDTELARELRVDKRTVSAWRSRGSVPKRFKAILDGHDISPINAAPLQWTDHERAAFSLALFRYGRAYAQELGGEDFHRAMGVVEFTDDFWGLMFQAQQDISRLISSSVRDPLTALAVLIHEDIEHSSEAVERSKQQLREHRPTVRVDGTPEDISAWWSKKSG